MVTYDEVKTKIENLYKQIISDLAYKRAFWFSDLAEKSETFIKEIVDTLTNSLKAVSNLNVDTYLSTIYSSYTPKAIGEKAVRPVYADDTITIDNREVIPYDMFEFDPTFYLDRMKALGDYLSKDLVLARIPISESPPKGDFEDVSYVYYIPESFTAFAEFGINLYDSTGQYGEIPLFAEFDLYAVKTIKVEEVRGAFEYFRIPIGEDEVALDLATGGIIKAWDENLQNYRELAYKYVMVIWNFTSYPVDVMFGTKPHRVSSNSYAVYLYVTDVHLKATPLKILETSL